jgi:hypothetical protein
MSNVPFPVEQSFLWNRKEYARTGYRPLRSPGVEVAESSWARIGPAPAIGRGTDHLEVAIMRFGSRDPVGAWSSGL